MSTIHLHQTTNLTPEQYRRTHRFRPLAAQSSSRTVLTTTSKFITTVAPRLT